MHFRNDQQSRLRPTKLRQAPEPTQILRGIESDSSSESDSAGDSEFPDDAITRKRRLLAMFCKTLGEKNLGEKPRGEKTLSEKTAGERIGGRAELAHTQPPNLKSPKLPLPPVLLEHPLSPRQRQTLELLLAGNAEKQIAARLAISRHTVHVYVKSLYKCFGVCSRAELLARWVQR